MNKATIIGNLTRDPELRTTTSGINVCSFTVAVNRRQTAQQRQNGQQPEADFFNVSAWRELGENCARYLAKGRKVCVVGPVSVRSFTRSDGTAGASLEITADEVEFLTPKGDQPAQQPAAQQSQPVPAVQPAPAAYATVPAAQAPAQISMAAIPAGYTQVAADDTDLPF